ncbi:SRPBCC domain-containing protein [Dietzia sp. ANT_WB102]|uniref:SRPBCC domain-containing protein n=1 Tax=Dietzia sp. ANT_WB102 TaxID=2597345 RepID=UPI0011EC423F|nr:SRPBCC domain-containing protein [Dietzia sp. ANT_WB102]KAA0918682.1 transcriptional regulator [Dietzia sp. ANT_WB102]
MTSTPTASGYLAPSGAVVFSRRLPMSREAAWSAITDPARTVRWIGSWSGDPESGSIEMTMSAEEGAPAESVEVLRCEAPSLVVVRIGSGGWVVTVRIEGDDNEATVSLEQDIADAQSASDIGPGWDFYMDRLVEAEAGRDPGALRFSPDYHPALAGHYRALLGG